jgi:hypothetical protein
MTARNGARHSACRPCGARQRTGVVPQFELGRSSRIDCRALSCRDGTTLVSLSWRRRRCGNCGRAVGSCNFHICFVTRCPFLHRLICHDARNNRQTRKVTHRCPRGPRGDKRPADVVSAAVMVAKIATGEIRAGTAGPSGRSSLSARRQRFCCFRCLVACRSGTASGKWTPRAKPELCGLPRSICAESPERRAHSFARPCSREAV